MQLYKIARIGMEFRIQSVSVYLISHWKMLLPENC